ncbi:MAG: chromosome segregation protein SMC [Saprospiraceae bacterium]|nr:chromosome segregation protein SMC [Saprospiraceae bacterium]
MRLKQLSIKGFKSFANETIINFSEDVIGIVGPNGSGKSNVVDAIRWVLGEQKSKELRLDTMSSVIFNGTKSRKPGGVAQVALTFDNTKNILPTEYQTVTITRLLYRSGESEYQLNNVPCRLKDITSLFLDTGIGSNSYAIIALGMVDDILADKDNSRRKMFEQAAGISKYKVRKRETLNKLKHTTEDLDRVEDLLFEIDNNLKVLEKQAKRTKRYFELKAEYKELSVELAVRKIYDLKNSHKALEKQIQEETDRYRQYEIDERKFEAQLESEKKANLDKEKALSERQRDLNNLVGKIRGQENDKRMLEQKQQFILQNIEKLKSQNQQAQSRIAQLSEDIEYYRAELNNEKRIEMRLEDELDKTEEQMNKIKTEHGNMKSSLDDIVQVQQKIEREVFELEKQKAISRNQIETAKQELGRDDKATQQRKAEIQQVDEQLKALDSKESEKQAALKVLEDQETQRKKALEIATKELEDLNQRRAKVNRQLDAKRNEFKLTQSMIENLEGFPESIRFLSNNKNWGKEAPLLSDLIYVKEAYRVAVENYLEPYLNYYVVQNQEEALQAITLLGKSQKGKANFFLLDSFKDYIPPIGLIANTMQAIEVIEIDPLYHNLCSYLLENVMITDKEEPPLQSLDSDVTLLSKSGRFIQKKHSVSGGSIGLFEGKKIGRKKNLEILEVQIQKSESEENKLSTAYFNLKNRIDQLRTEKSSRAIEIIQNDINRLSREKVSFQTRMENFQTYINEANNKKQQILQRISTLEESIQKIELQLSERNIELVQAKQNISSTDGSFRKIAEQLSAASTKFNEKNIEFIRQQNKVSSFQRELSFREKQLEETKNNLQNDKSTFQRSAQELDQVHKDIDQLEKNLLAAYEDKKARASLLTEAEQSYFKARGNINTIEDQLRKANRSRQDSQILINNLKEKFSDVKFKISSIGQRLKIEFNIGVNDIINQEPNEKYNEIDLQQKVDRLYNRLDNYGEINPMAVEAYDEMKERHESITKQRDDILKAKASLIETIGEIEETATNQFLTAFEKARIYFIDVFRSLFSEEDNCDLILLDPENPLDSKIEIVAKPKGKRPQTISQLSGGEKTLTATALLFALYLLKPAPFCIFDEVDAPLDDANIMKFNRIIKKFSKESQFIIVTHNKLTMAAVDTIYGVYNESGVSGVTSVDFRDFSNNATFEAKES